jgi:hypothetical protein
VRRDRHRSFKRGHGNYFRRHKTIRMISKKNEKDRVPPKTDVFTERRRGWGLVALKDKKICPIASSHYEYSPIPHVKDCRRPRSPEYPKGGGWGKWLV